MHVGPLVKSTGNLPSEGVRSNMGGIAVARHLSCCTPVAAGCPEKEEASKLFSILL